MAGPALAALGQVEIWRRRGWSGLRRLSVPERIRGENWMESSWPGVDENVRSRIAAGSLQVCSFHCRCVEQLGRLLSYSNARSVWANPGNYMLSNRTLGKFFTTQDMCMEKVRASERALTRGQGLGVCFCAHCLISSSTSLNTPLPFFGGGEPIN